MEGARNAALIGRSRSRSGSNTEAFGDRLPRLKTDQAIDEVAVFEKKHGRDAGDLKARSGLRVFIDVQFGNDILAF